MAGRKPDPNKMTFWPIGLRPDGWKYVGLWNIGDESNPTRAINELIEFVQKFRPNGAGASERVVKAPRYRAPRSVNNYMSRHGLTRSEALALIAKKYADEHPEEFM